VTFLSDQNWDQQFIRLEIWADRSLKKFRKGKSKSLPLGLSDLTHQYQLGADYRLIDSQNHRIMERFGLEGTLYIISFQPPLPWADTPSTRPSCSKPHPTWPSTLPEKEHPQLLLQPVPVPHHTHSKEVRSFI